MKRLILSIVLASIPLWTMDSVYGQNPGQPPKAAAGWNQYQCPKHPEITASWPGKCPKCGANLVPRHLTGRMMSYRPKAMETRRKIMLNTSIDVFDPEAILCAKRPLGLTREQIEQLRAISMTAQQCAKEVLNDRQRRELNSLESLHNYPRTMAQMHHLMMQRISSPETMMSKMMQQQMMNPSTGRKADPPSDPKADPPSDPEAGNLRGSSDFERVIPQNQFRDNMRDRFRDNLRDRYRDEYRDRFRDRLRDHYRDEYRDRFRDNFGSGDQGFGNEGFGNEGFGDQGFGDEGFGDEGFGDEGFNNDEGFGNDEGFSGGDERFGGDEGSEDNEGGREHR